MFRRTKGKEAERLRRLSKILISLTILVVLFVLPCDVFGTTTIYIKQVNIIPLQPVDTDIINFEIFGRAGQSGSWVEYDQFSQDGLTIYLDICINYGSFRAFSDWTYTKQISPLPANTYTLEVRAFDYEDNSLRDTYTTEFTVVPEPATFFLLCGGVLAIRSFSRKK